MKRDDGCYWVKNQGQWEVAEYKHDHYFTNTNSPLFVK